jgi:hypothetical protein
LIQINDQTQQAIQNKPMKKTKSTLMAGALVLAAVNQVYGQYTPPPPPVPFPGFVNDYLRKQDPYMNQWDIGGAVRMRYEIKENGMGIPPANDFRDVTPAGARNDNSYFSDKILARVGYTDKWWSAYIEGRSSLTYGDERSRTGAGAVPAPGAGGDGGPEQDGPVDLHQAYFTLGNHKEFPVSLKVGRQELSYGDERLVGAFAWNNIGRVFDAVKVRAQTPWFAAEAFTSKLVLPVDNHFNVWNDYNLFSGLYLTSKLVPKNTTELYFFARNDSVGSSFADPNAVLPFQTAAPAARDIYTVGARFKSNPGELGNFDYTVEGAYQFGNWKAATNSARLDQQAFAVMANGGYTFADAFGTPRVGLEYNFASGDSDPTDGKHETFDNLYPTNHKFYGYMDFFSWQNLHDVRAIFTIKPTTRLSLAIEGHGFWLADTHDNLYNAGGVSRGAGANANGFGRNPSYGSFVGTELDVIAGYALTKFANLEAGYGHFFTGDYVDATWSNVGGSADADWIYMQTVVRF